ncbi:pimeloyl-ACP methyl ester carboxylesterase [Mesorhizobium soli]|jgi:pimeloyl-ACP methyl ester carboxylesterase|uniref:alpha/beta hydrolase n=1 Tax=Pseudaminobacter soli (ex Li et al. 2025) TaxID=1295366 RepID=UPI002474FC8E|nr:alpha/beta hydrolase [Mesorhizobium soli]MDH6232765.1 pimeloyl-ACP methyl ester carboxylesterase [Mesorhizobium soli]
MASIALKVIRGVFGAAELVAPRLGGRIGFELFCRTPNPKVLTAGERRAVERAVDFMAEARHHRIKVGSNCVAVHEFRPGEGRPFAGTVLVIHGWRSRTEYMHALIEGCRDAGFRVVSLDLPGHGASTGRRLNMASGVAAARAGGEWFGPFAAVIGHSFGGAVAANAVAGAVDGVAPIETRRLVMIAAPNALSEVFDGFRRYVNLGRRSASALDDRIRRLSGHGLAHFTSAKQLARLSTPTLVVHAPDDAEVSAEDARNLARAGDHVRLVWAEGLGHRRILSDPGIVQQVVGFVAAADEPAPLH